MPTAASFLPHHVGGGMGSSQGSFKMQAYNRRSAYHWYLGSAFWRERREFALKRANYRCERCKERRATEVHHVTYIRVFNEMPTDLVAVCRQCHGEMHHKKAANDNQLSLFDNPELPKVL